MNDCKSLCGFRLSFVLWRALVACVFTGLPNAFYASVAADHLREIQHNADAANHAEWGHWGTNPRKYTQWSEHSNRLVPIYTFGINLDKFTGRRSAYRNRIKLKAIYGRVPTGSLNRSANYMDQTDVYRLQKQALNAGKKYIVLIVFDGMDWQVTQAASIYKSQAVSYVSGRGHGLCFQDYRGTETDYGFVVTSPHNSGTFVDVDAQLVRNPGGHTLGGYCATLGGASPWARPNFRNNYLLGKRRDLLDAVTDSAASITAMTSGIKTYNLAVNVDPQGRPMVPIARELQTQRGFAIGIVTSVAISDATPAGAYGNNVSRRDYQDLTRDLLGLPSISNRDPLPGVDVLLGGGWGETDYEANESSTDEEMVGDASVTANARARVDDDGEDEEGKVNDFLIEKPKGGSNYVCGNKSITDADILAVNMANGGQYVVAQRTSGRKGAELLFSAADEALEKHAKLFGFFGAAGGHLPYRTADGNYDPCTVTYTKADITENPTLDDYTSVALRMLAPNKNGFWLMIEAGDVDLACHENNIDDAIGAVLSGDDAFRTVTQWVEENDAWKETAIIVTADHGHCLNLLKPAALIRSKE